MAPKLLIAAGELATDPEELPPGVRGLIDAADKILGQLEGMDSQARGAVGSDDPLEALADFIRDFAPDHLLIALRGGEGAGWRERGLLDQVQERFGLPMTVFSVPAGWGMGSSRNEEVTAPARRALRAVVGRGGGCRMPPTGPAPDRHRSSR